MISRHLRPGNWVQRFARHNKEFICYEKVQKLDLQYPYGEFPSSYCEPIRLTPEILEKCAVFKTDKSIKDNILYKINKTTGSHFAFDSSRGEYLMFASDWNGGYFAFTSFKYLHQLQNLYFALTNSELSINL